MSPFLVGRYDLDNIQATGAHVLDDYRGKSGFKNNLKFLSHPCAIELKQHLKDAVCFFVGTDKAEVESKGAVIVHFEFLLPGAQSKVQSAKVVRCP